jgi:hypothetical protein
VISVVWWLAIPTWTLCLIGATAWGYLLGKGRGAWELERMTKKFHDEAREHYQSRMAMAGIIKWQSRDTIGRSDPGAET